LFGITSRFFSEKLEKKHILLKFYYLPIMEAINIPNIVLKSALRSHADGFSVVAHINPGNFVKNADETRRVFADTTLHTINVSETFFKGSR
jgi:hypothetical protein